MIELRPLTALNLADLERVASGYSSDSQYVVHYTSAEDHISFDLQLASLDKPFAKKFDHDDEILQHYKRVLHEGYSFGVYDEDLLVGLIIGEPHEWNRSLWVLEFHVIDAYRNEGIGKHLMEAVAQRAKMQGFGPSFARRKIRMSQLSMSIVNLVFTWKELIFPTIRTMTTRMVR